MNIIKAHKNLFATLMMALMALMALIMLPACSSTEESSDCNCAEGDVQCLDRCEQNI